MLFRFVFLLLCLKHFFRNVFFRLKNSTFPILIKALNFFTNEYQWISNSVIIFMARINEISPFVHPKLFSKSSINTLPAQSYFRRKPNTMAFFMLLIVLTVTLGIVMILSHVLNTNHFSNFVHSVIPTIFALIQIRIPALLLEK